MGGSLVADCYLKPRVAQTSWLCTVGDILAGPIVLSGLHCIEKLEISMSP